MRAERRGFPATVRAALGALGLCALATSAAYVAGAQDALSPAEVVDAFTAAIDRGDRTAALALLTRDVIILEEGFADRSRADYEGQHLALDIGFASVTARTLQSRRQGGDGDLHWVVSLYSDEGLVDERTMKQSTAETVLLRRVGEQWRIAHLHWSNEDPQPVAAPPQ